MEQHWIQPAQRGMPADCDPEDLRVVQRLIRPPEWHWLVYDPIVARYEAHTDPWCASLAVVQSLYGLEAGPRVAALVRQHLTDPTYEWGYFQALCLWLHTLMGDRNGGDTSTLQWSVNFEKAVHDLRVDGTAAERAQLGWLAHVLRQTVHQPLVKHLRSGYGKPSPLPPMAVDAPRPFDRMLLTWLGEWAAEPDAPASKRPRADGPPLLEPEPDGPVSA